MLIPTLRSRMFAKHCATRLRPSASAPAFGSAVSFHENDHLLVVGTRHRASSSIIRQDRWLGLCVDGGHALEGGKGLDGFSDFLLGDAQIVEALQIDPEFGTGAEPSAGARRR